MLRGTAMENEPHEAVGVVSSVIGGKRWLLVEQPGPPVARIAGDPRDAQRACFEGGAQRVREENGRVERLVQPAGEAPRTFAGFDGEHLVDCRHTAPKRGKLGWTKNGEMQVGTSLFARFRRGDAHHGVAQPGARPDDKTEGSEVFGGKLGRKVVAAFEAASAEETRHGRFPAVVDPEPVGRSGFDLFFEVAVEQISQLAHRTSVWLERGLDHTPPPRRADGVDGDGNDGCLRADGQRRGEGRGRGQFAEERGPYAGIARVLIDEDGQNATALDHFRRTDIAVASAERLHAQPAAVAVDEAVEILVALWLENDTDGIFADMTDELGVEFPVADVVDGHDHAAAEGEGLAEDMESLDFDPRLHGGLGHPGEARRAQEIGAEPAKMKARGAPHVGGGHRRPESDRDVTLRQFTVAGQDGPGGQAEDPPETEDDAEGQAPENRQQGEDEQIQGVIHGAEREN